MFKEVFGFICYIDFNLGRVSKVVDFVVVEVVFNVVIEVDNFEVVIGVVEVIYFFKFYLCVKVIRKGFFFVGLVGVVFLVFYFLVFEFVQFQLVWDYVSVIKIVFVGVFCYVGFIGIIGMVVVFIVNDQMKWVMWVIGIFLGY